MNEVTSAKGAELLNVSESRFRHLFKEHMGFSFHQYVIRLRLERARQMLCEEGMAPLEVIRLLNIRHSSNFFADFKRAFGATPSELRARFVEERSLRSLRDVVA
jgi:two-component system response regulator YesN